VLVAGDSENDASMLRLALPGVLVGNADAALRRQAHPTDHRVHATAQGAAGILEGLRTLQSRGVLLS
jgi:hydroxymethylpyrimidine pyrophosphatase-like HAD family hydrolase